jgi:multidrug efflux system membrane fusion protein
MVKAETSQLDAETGLKRREQAVAQHPGLIPGEEVESFRTKWNLASAELSQAKAALETAQLNLRDAHLRAPIAGTIETKSVETGQYVQPGAVLATLLRRDPLLLRFKVPEADAARLQRGMVAHFRVRSDQEEYSAKLEHVAQAADDASRMVSIVAEVEEGQAGAALRPGAFAEVSVAVGASVDAPVIPEIAIRPSEAGFLAYVVEGGVAKQRTLTLGMRTADGKVEVRSGLAAGELLVVRGSEALRDGVKVKVVDGEGSESDKPGPGSTLNGAGPRAAREQAVPATRTAQ